MIAPANLFGARERRETLLLMAAIALTVMPHLGTLSLAIALGFCTLFGWRLALLLTRRETPGVLVRRLGVVAAAAAIFAAYGTLLGREAGVALLVLLLGLKLLELRARRDQFVVIFLCFFLLLTAFLESQSMITAALVLLAVFALVLNMLTIQLQGREVPLRSRLRTSALLLAQAIPLTLLLFVLFPRVQGPLWGMPRDTRSASTGLSESMSPGDITQLTDSEAVAFRVLFDDREPTASQRYWRGPVLGSFDGRRWSPQRELLVRLPPLQVSADPGSTLSYTVTLEPTRRPWLMALEAPMRLLAAPGGGARLDPQMMMLSTRAISDRIRYRVESSADFRYGLNETQLSLRNWMALPPGFNRRTLTLAGEWRAGQTDPAELVQQALRMFREQPFRYTRTPPALGADSVDDFLFNTRAGFCEHYASAFVVLMRALDIPSRVVTGYQGGERNPVDGYWTVRQSDAHAWAEVWLEGRGWVRIDPTAAVAPERVERGAQALRDPGVLAGLGISLPAWRGLQMNLDALVNAWNQWVLGYDDQSQLRLLSRIGMRTSDWKALAGLLAGSLALAIGVIAIAMMRAERRRDPLQRCFTAFCAQLARVGIVYEPHETAQQLLARAAPRLQTDALQAATQIVSQYNALRYAQQTPPHDPNVRHLRSLIRAFKP